MTEERLASAVAAVGVNKTWRPAAPATAFGWWVVSREAVTAGFSGRGFSASSLSPRRTHHHHPPPFHPPSPPLAHTWA